MLNIIIIIIIISYLTSLDSSKLIQKRIYVLPHGLKDFHSYPSSFEFAIHIQYSFPLHIITSIIIAGCTYLLL